jgi:ABC-2 type transport system permease protein
VNAVTVFRRPGVAVTGLAVREVYRGALVVTVLAGGMSALVAGTYASTVGDSMDASSLAALAANPAIRTLFGEPHALDTAGGFTVWRTGTVVAVLVAMWGLLAATRVMRGEEDAGRWDLLLAGRLAVARVVARHVAVLVAAAFMMGAAVAAALLAVGTDPDGALLHGLGIALTGCFFVGAGGLAGQIWPARSAATGAAVALLVAGLLARMVGDGVVALSWLRWLTPFGLLELSQPYAGDDWPPVIPLAVAAAAVVFAGPAAAVRRDLRGGWVNPPVGRPPRLSLLGSVPAFAVRRTLRPLAGWSLGIAAYCLLIGLIAESMTRFLTENGQFAAAAAQAGFADLGSVKGYAGTLLTLLAVPIGVFAAVRIATLASDETGGRLTQLYAQPVTRRTVAGSEAATGAGGATVLALVAATSLWLGTAVAGADLPWTAALAGGVNGLPITALCVGAALLALGLTPRLVVSIGSLPAVGGFLWLVIADSIDAPAWVADLSPFAHLAAVPAQSPDWPGTAGMLTVAAALTAVGLWAYQRRDLRVS